MRYSVRIPVRTSPFLKPGSCGSKPIPNLKVSWGFASGPKKIRHAAF